MHSRTSFVDPSSLKQLLLAAVLLAAVSDPLIFAVAHCIDKELSSLAVVTRALGRRYVSPSQGLPRSGYFAG